MTGRNWTELFFLDEAVALAAGHRPCAYCRRTDFTRFQRAWARSKGQITPAPKMDATLHAARVTRHRKQITHQRDIADLPNGTFVLHDGRPHLIWDHALWPFARSGYDTPTERPQGGTTLVLTPAPAVDVLTAGYRPWVTLPGANR